MTIEQDKKILIRILKRNTDRIGNSMMMGVGAETTEDIIGTFKYKKNKDWAQSLDFKIIDIHLRLTNFIEFLEKTPAYKLFQE